MARNGEVNIAVVGDSTDAQKAFDDVADSAKDAAHDIERASDDTESGFRKLGDGIDDSESKFRGLGDTIGGTGDIMQGFKDGNVIGIAMGFADLAGGITGFVVPALTAMSGFITTTLIPTLTAVATHPLFLAILAGGAIIVGLILLEKKFGIVSSAIDGLKRAAGAVFDFITDKISAVVGAIRTVWNSTIGGKGIHIPSVGVGPFRTPGLDLEIPKLHSGGVVRGGPATETLALLQGGERVLPNGSSGAAGVTIVVQGSLIHERDLPLYVARAGRDAALAGVTF